jgi:hypothetical protein
MVGSSSSHLSEIRLFLSHNLKGVRLGDSDLYVVLPPILAGFCLILTAPSFFGYKVGKKVHCCIFTQFAYFKNDNR